MTDSAKKAAAKKPEAKKAEPKAAAPKAAAKKPESKKAEKKESKQVAIPKPNRQPVRLYSRAVFVGFRRNLRNSHPEDSLVKIEGVNTKADTEFYLGKRVAYIYRAKTAVKGTKYRVIWGRIRRAHGSNGVVRAKFRNNLPSHAIGGSLRVMLYPSRV